MEKTFKLEEANMLLPILESLLRQAMEAKIAIEKAEEQARDLAHKIFLSGGVSVDIAASAKREATKEKAVQTLKDSVAEIHATGVQVKDLDIGLLDFPCLVNGETVLLCWKFGEGHEVKHWHGMSEGFAGRKPIETLDFQNDPEKPN